MNRLIRTLALLLALLMLAATLSSCKNADTPPNRILKKTIGTCAGYEVPYEELRYIVRYNRYLIETTYGEQIWNDPERGSYYREELSNLVWDSILNNYAVLSLCAKYGLTAEDLESEEIQAAVEEDIQEAISEYGGKSAFREALAAQYMTERFVRFSLSVAQLENELYYVLTQDLGLIESDLSRFVEWLESGNCVRVQHVFIRNDANDSVEENRATAESVRLQLSQGVDIGTFIDSTVNEDTSNVAPYYIVRDVYIEELENAAFGLHYEGAVSPVIETDTGFYVLVRMEDNRTNLLSNASSLLQSYQWAKLEEMVDAERDLLHLELNEFGKSLDIYTMK